MLQYLGKLDIENWQRSNLALRQPGTGTWFTDGESSKHGLQQRIQSYGYTGSVRYNRLDIIIY